MKHTLDTLVAWVVDNPNSDFYRAHWQGAREFASLPTVSRADFLRVPLSKRRYKEEKALTKIVHTVQGPFLAEWSFNDIDREPLGDIGVRPLVYLDDPHEAIEKSMWCYGNNRVPLIGEKDPDLTMFAAGKYQVDSLITDTVSVQKIAPYFTGREPLEHLVVLGSSPEEFAGALPFAAHAKSARAVLRLPEVGIIASAPLRAPLRFEPVEGVHIEKDAEGYWVVTKEAPLVTPVVRYQTTIRHE